MKYPRMPFPFVAKSLRDGQVVEFGSDEAVIPVSSKVGQRYVCHYKTTPPKPADEAESDPAQIKIIDLLEPMRGNCLIKHKDWWSYEFCYGEKISQFHVQEGVVSGEVISLGKFESDKEWKAEDLEMLKKSPLSRYHTQNYVNGSVCDLTKNERKTEVRFSCIEGEVDQIGAVAELESCSYILFIYTSKICHHPYLRPPVRAKPSPIECQPLVSQSAYDSYIQEQQRQLADSQTKNEQTEEAGESSENDDSLLKNNLDEIKSLLSESFGDTINFDDMDIEIVEADSASAVNERVAQALEKFKTVETAKTTEHSTSSSTTDESATSSQKEARSQKETGSQKEIESSEAESSADAVSLLRMAEIQKKIMADLLKELDMGQDEDADSMAKTVSENRQLIKTIVASQFDTIIDEAYLSVSEEEGELEIASSETRRLMKIKMEEIVDELLDQLEGGKKKSTPRNKAVSKPEGPPTDEEDDSADYPKVEVKANGVTKIQLVQPRKLEVEMLDIDEIDEDSRFYTSAQTAREKLTTSESGKPRAVLAVVKPYQSPGSRREVKQQSQLEENYGKLWRSSEDDEEHDEL